ncbi:MAG: hypothetical protein WHT06_10350 [Desulfobacterales bacterium]
MGQDALAVRASKKLKNDELLVTNLAASRLRMELDRVPLWRGDHVAIRQLVDDFARYLYLPRLKEPSVLVEAIRSGLALLTWEADSFAFAESYDEAGARYRGLQFARPPLRVEADSEALLVKPEVARRQLEAEGAAAPATSATRPAGGVTPPGSPAIQPPGGSPGASPVAPPRARPKRFHGTVTLEATRVGRDASRVADEVITHLAGLVGAKVKVTLEIEAEIPAGVPENVVRTVTENSRALKFDSQGFESE